MNCFMLLLLMVSMLEAVGASSANQSDVQTLLPDGWDRFCEHGVMERYSSLFTQGQDVLRVRCMINQTTSGMWKFKTFRDANLTSSVPYWLDVTCTEAANISLLWPLKANNLFGITIRGCVVVDYLKEFKSDAYANIPDSLRVLEIINSRIKINMASFMAMLKNPRLIKKDFDCVHTNTLERLVFRKISYQFNPLEMKQMMAADLSTLGASFMSEIRKIEYKCNYKHLLYIQELDSHSMSIYHIPIVTADAVFDELRVYNLSHNRVRNLKDQMLQWSRFFPKLEMFDLSHNNISQLYNFERPLHTDSSRLTTISLQFNNITQLTVGNLFMFSNLTAMFIDVRNNPFICNCNDEMKALLYFIKSKMDSPGWKRYEYIKHLRCSSPEQLTGKEFTNIGLDDLQCPVNLQTVEETEFFVVPVVCLSVAVIALCLIILILVRYRREVRIIMYTRFNVILPCQPEEYMDNRKYDAFVSYSNKDEKWVEDTFESLEKPQSDKSRPFRFCLHHRDFIPGKTIFDNVIDSIESSRHTIVLLSRSFVKSEYCLYEFQEAFHQSILEQKRHMILVLMEDIPNDELPKEIRRCIKTFTYIRKDDFLFVDRIIYALSVKQNRKQKNELSVDAGELQSAKCHVNIGFEDSDELNGDFLRSISTFSGDTGYSSSSERSPSINLDSPFETFSREHNNETEQNQGVVDEEKTLKNNDIGV